MDALAQPIRFGAEEAAYRFHYFLALLMGRRRTGKMRTLLVNGSPKTGTTWMVNMLASLPGYGIAGNFHGRIDRYLDARPGEVIHGHDRWTPELWHRLEQKDIRVIMMYRDPRDQAVSRMFHIRREKRHAWHRHLLEMPDDSALMACIEGSPDEHLPGIEAMTGMTKSWQQERGHAILVRYEDLAADPLGQMQNVFRHADIPVTRPFLKTIIARNRFERLTVGRQIFRKSRQQGQSDSSSHYRKGIVGDWKNHFKSQHIQRSKELAGQTLIDWGYESDLDW